MVGANCFFKKALEELNIILNKGMIIAKEKMEKTIPRILNPRFKKRVLLNCKVILAILIKFFIFNHLLQS